MKTIAIIGGGAAGMMAAATICENAQNVHVVLIEKNAKLGQKVALTGGGRCNVTTGLTDIKEVLGKYPRGSRFLRDAMYNFPPSQMWQWVEQHGVPLKTEDDMRVFPKSNKGDDIVGIFEKIFKSSEVLLNKTVTKIEKKNGKFAIDDLEADKIILTTGGTGHDLAVSLGHKITPLAPSLSPFLIEEEWVKTLTGISFEKARLRIKKHDFTGPILLTHQGVTGPAVFAISALSAYEKLQTTLLIDFLPDTTHDELIEQIASSPPQQSFQNTLSRFIPKSFAKIISSDRKNAEISKKDLNKAIESIKNTKLTITGHTAGKEFVIAGGIDLSEVDSKTMQSKICPGLYLAGEILDIDGFTGGFNLQSAWATGRLAGESAGS